MHVCLFKIFMAANLANRSNDIFGTRKNNCVGEDLHPNKIDLTTKKSEDAWYGFWCPFQECCLIIPIKYNLMVTVLACIVGGRREDAKLIIYYFFQKRLF